MIKSLIVGLIVLSQIALISRLGSGMQGESLWMLLLVATLPLIKGILDQLENKIQSVLKGE